MLAIVLAVAVVHGPLRSATPTLGPPSSRVPSLPAGSTVSVDGSFRLTLTLSGSLAGIRPDVAKAAWLCSARILTQSAIDAEMARLQGMAGPAMRAEFSSFLEYRAHYLGQQVTVEVPLASGATGAVPPIGLTLKRDDLVDPATRRAIDEPAVLVGCWLQLANAAGQGGFATDASASPGNAGPLATMLQVDAPPWIIASAGIPNG